MRLEIQFLSCTSHISGVQQPHVASKYCIGQCGCGTFPPSQGVLDGTALKQLVSFLGALEVKLLYPNLQSLLCMLKYSVPLIRYVEKKHSSIFVKRKK